MSNIFNKIITRSKLKMDKNSGNKIKVALLGGSFDPPTMMHMNVSDQVWIIPCGERTDKALQSTPKNRMEMTKLAVAEHFKDSYKGRIKVSDIEYLNGASIPTYYLMQKLFENPENSNYEFSWIIGTDLVDWLHTWDEGDKLKAEIDFVITNRVGVTYNPEKLPAKHTMVGEICQSNVSSTMVRNRVMASYNAANDGEEELRNGLGIIGLVPHSVLDYIKENKLYQKKIE